MMINTMLDLPLLPLNAVLFPEMPLQLHIFEQRYRQMVQECLDNDAMFGIVLLRRGREVGSKDVDAVVAPFRWVDKLMKSVRCLMDA